MIYRIPAINYVSKYKQGHEPFPKFNTTNMFHRRISQAQGPYEAIPLIRPIVLCGPSLRNFDVTDLMHKALFHALKRAFGDKLEVVHIEEKWLKPFHNALANKHLVGTTG